MNLNIQNYPTHVGLIPDGCRRWAVKRAFKPWEGHRKGIKVLEDIGRWSFENLPIKYYTVYGLSLENLKNRSSTLLKILFKMYSDHFIKMSKDETVHKIGVNVGAIGNLNLLPKELRESIKIAQRATASYTNKYFRVALAYSGRKEIVDAANRLVKNKKRITENSISKNLYFNFPDPDLIIRSSEKRISNFLLWESAYSELYFIDKLWPDVTKNDYIAALKDFDKRKRRYGK